MGERSQRLSEGVKEEFLEGEVLAESEESFSLGFFSLEGDLGEGGLSEALGIPSGVSPGYLDGPVSGVEEGEEFWKNW